MFYMLYICLPSTSSTVKIKSLFISNGCDVEIQVKFEELSGSFK